MKLSLHVAGLDEKFKLTKYIKGLKKSIRAGVKAQRPDSIKEAIVLVKIYEKIYVNTMRSKSFDVVMQLLVWQQMLHIMPIFEMAYANPRNAKLYFLT